MTSLKYTPFRDVYKVFLSKITDDMYMELTPQDTQAILQELLLSSLHWFEFPRQSLDYQIKKFELEDQNGNLILAEDWVFLNKLTNEEVNIISTYMVVEWIGQQLASIENVRMKYSGPDFKFTSQANHMQKLGKLQSDYKTQGFHLQRLYKRRKQDENGVYKSTLGNLMKKQPRGGTGQWNEWF